MQSTASRREIDKREVEGEKEEERRKEERREMEEERNDGGKKGGRREEGGEEGERDNLPLARHLISKNFSIPISAPNPASVTT